MGGPNILLDTNAGNRKEYKELGRIFVGTDGDACTEHESGKRSGEKMVGICEQDARAEEEELVGWW